VCHVRVASGCFSSAEIRFHISNKLAMAITPISVRRTDPRSFLIFTPLSRPCFKSGFHSHARSSGNSTLPSDTYTVHGNPPLLKHVPFQLWTRPYAIPKW
jgi:hypothetical protein